MSYEYNILNTKILHAARLTDPATYVSISILAKDAREYLKSKKIEVNEKESLMLIIAALAHNRDAAMPAIIRRHIISCKTFYEELNKQAEEKEAAGTAAEEPTEPEELDATAAEELAKLITPEEPENCKDRPHSANRFRIPGCESK